MMTSETSSGRFTKCLVAEFQKHFNIFQNDVSRHSSKKQARNIDLTIPEAVIDMFGKIFHLWKENEVLNHQLKPELLRNIYVDMKKFFVCRVDNYELVCDSCDEPFPFNDDLKYSYELHITNKMHQKAIQNFNYLTTLSKPQTNFNPQNSIKSAPFVLKSSNELQCLLCNSVLKTDQAAVRHLKSVTHRLEELSLDPYVEDQIVQIDNTLCCALCKIKLPSKDKTSHSTSAKHEAIKACYQFMKENSFIELLNNKMGNFVCHKCDVKSENWTELLKHSESENHRKFDQQSSTFQNASAQIYCEFPPEQGCSEIFNNNDIYFDIKLDSNSKQQFKCILCNKIVSDLDLMEVHCLTEEHHNLKSNLEGISKKSDFDHKEIADTMDGAIEPFDDFFHCKCCDVFINTLDDVIEHQSIKEHKVSLQVFETMRINNQFIKDCSECGDIGTKIYFCSLCSKTVDGDVNMIGHCKSNRHTQLADIVNKLKERYR